MADSQVPWGLNALGGAISEAAWRIRPSWYLVAADDRMIPPPAQRAMAERTGATVTEVPGSQSVYLSRPEAVASFIARAAGQPCSCRNTLGVVRAPLMPGPHHQIHGESTRTQIIQNLACHRVSRGTLRSSCQD
jgi:Alpha/beta hydrolase family